VGKPLDDISKVCERIFYDCEKTGYPTIDEIIQTNGNPNKAIQKNIREDDDKQHEAEKGVRKGLKRKAVVKEKSKKRTSKLPEDCSYDWRKRNLDGYTDVLECKRKAEKARKRKAKHEVKPILSMKLPDGHLNHPAVNSAKIGVSEMECLNKLQDSGLKTVVCVYDVIDSVVDLKFEMVIIYVPITTCMCKY